MIERLRKAFRVVPLSPEADAEQRQEEAEINRGRLQILLPFMIVVNLVHVVLYYLAMGLGLDELWNVSADILRWADGLYWVHLITALVALVPAVALYLVPKPTPRWLGPAAGLVYQLHAAAVTGVDQLNTGTVLPYIGYTLVNAVTVAMTPRQSIVFYGLSTVAFMVALTLGQPDPVLRSAVMPSGPSVMVPGVMIAWFFHQSRRRDFYFRRTIAAQRVELERLNGELRETVEEQVVSLKARAEEVERLNLALRERVRDRSRALAAALGKLAEHEAPAPASLEGTVLAGRYLLGRRLGAGGMGVVHEAEDLETGDPVAVKVIRHRERVTKAVLARFLREVETAATIEHPAVVRMHQVDVTPDGVLFQVQELVRGRPLSEVLDRGSGRLGCSQGLRILVTLCSALEAAHAQGVVHRDVKPSNLMLVDGDPGVKLLDFGIARPQGEELASLTATGAVIGTPAFMAPELWEGEVAGPAADVYAVGVTAVRMLTGRLPRLRGGFGELSLDDGLPAELVGLLRRCLDVNPEARPSAAELVLAFGALEVRTPVPEEGFDDGFGAGSASDEGEVETHLTWGD